MSDGKGLLRLADAILIPPFAGATARETLEQVREQEPAPPSHFNARVTPPLDAFCLRCLGKDPWRRHERAFFQCIAVASAPPRPTRRISSSTTGMRQAAKIAQV